MNTGKDIEFSDLPSIQSQLDVYNVLHMAAAILRSYLTNIKDSESYISSMNMDLINCRKYAPDSLYDFLSWCMDKTAFESISKGGSESDVQRMNLKVINICQNIIAQGCRQVRTPINIGHGLYVHHKSTREKILEAAVKRHDDVVRCRMITHSYLFAFNAKYHRSYYGHYISDRNIKALCSESASANGEEVTTCYDKAFPSAKSLLEETLLSNTTVVTNLAVLKSHYIEALCEMGVTDAQNYSSWKLKPKT